MKGISNLSESAESNLGLSIIVIITSMLFFPLFFLENSCFQVIIVLVLGVIYAIVFTFLLRKVSVQMWIFKERFLFVTIFFFLNISSFGFLNYLPSFGEYLKTIAYLTVALVINIVRIILKNLN